MVAFGTQDGEITLCTAEGYINDGSAGQAYDEFEEALGRQK